MHPVLKSALEPLAELVSGLSVEEAQVHPLPGHDRWCAQQILEHLMLTYQMTTDSVNRQLRTGRVLQNRRRLLEFLLRAQTLGLGYMPAGVAAIRAVRPTDYDPESGSATAMRFMETAEMMDVALVEGRKKFGIQTVGEHPLFGVMRVDEWRRYHAVHARHHLRQLNEVIRYARSRALVV